MITSFTSSLVSGSSPLLLISYIASQRTDHQLLIIHSSTLTNHQLPQWENQLASLNICAKLPLK
jgi:hypothetical protein